MRKHKINRKKIGALVCIGLTALALKHYPNKVVDLGVWSWDFDNKIERVVYYSGIENNLDLEFTYNLDEVNLPSKTNEVAIIDTNVNKITNISSKAINFIKSKEGFRSEAYKLNGEQNFTIGYGTSNRSIRPNQRVTEAEAHDLMMKEIEDITKYVLSFNLDLNQGELDSLVSFTYNCGKGNLRKLVKNRTKSEIAEHLTAYTGSSSKANKQGLLNRRLQEREMFLNGN